MQNGHDRLTLLAEVLGPHNSMTGSHYKWRCPVCAQRGADTKEDNFVFDLHSGKYNCFADSAHTKIISQSLREKLYGGERKKGKFNPNHIPIEEAPQEILDYWEERKINVETLKHFEVKFDKCSSALAIPSMFKWKYKPLHGDSWWYPKSKLSENTLYSPEKEYKGQKKFLYLEGIPDVWAIYSNFPKEFFTEFYVCGTVHGCTHIPSQWKDPKYWENFTTVYLCGDTDEPGRKACDKLQKLIGDKAKIVELPFKHKRLVRGEVIHYSSKDFNDWIIEGGTYEGFIKLLSEDRSYDEMIEHLAWEDLKSPNFFERYIDDVNTFGYVREERNKAQVILENNSRLTNDIAGGLSSRGVAPTAVGKTTLYKTIGKNMFTEDFIVLGDMSDKAMIHLADDEWRHKIILMEEDYSTKENPSTEAKEYLFRIAKSEGKFSYMYTDTSKKPFTSIRKEMFGPWVFQTASTKTRFKDEDVNRDTVHHLDESAAQTAAINEQQKIKESSLNPEAEFKQKVTRDKHRKIQQILKDNIPDNIVIPEFKKIKFPSTLHRARRDLPRLARYIQVCAFIHQFQRRVLTLEEYEKEFGHSIGHDLKQGSPTMSDMSELTPKNLYHGHENNKTDKAEEECQKEKIVSDTNSSTTDENGLNKVVVGSSIGHIGHDGILSDIGVCPTNSQELEGIKPNNRQVILSDINQGGWRGYLKKFKESYGSILIAERADIEIVLKYVAPELSKEYLQLDSTTTNRYNILRDKFGCTEFFSAKHAAPTLCVSTRQFHRIMEQFEDEDLIRTEKTGRRWKYALNAVNISSDDYGIIAYVENEFTISDEDDNLTNGKQLQSAMQEKETVEEGRERVLPKSLFEDEDTADEGSQIPLLVGNNNQSTTNRDDAGVREEDELNISWEHLKK